MTFAEAWVGMQFALKEFLYEMVLAEETNTRPEMETAVKKMEAKFVRLTKAVAEAMASARETMAEMGD